MVKVYNSKKGQIFMFFLVFITILSCFLVAYAYILNQRTLYNGFASPEGIIEENSDFSYFNLGEELAIRTLFCEKSESFGSGDVTKLKEDYCLGFFIKNDFLFSGIKYKGSLIPDTELESDVKRIEFCRAIYSFSYADGMLNVSRESFTKSSKIVSESLADSSKKEKKGFSVDYDYKVNPSKYLLTSKDCEK